MYYIIKYKFTYNYFWNFKKNLKIKKNFLTIKKIYIQHLVAILSRYDNYTGFVILNK